ncbi:MAG: type III-B CRISPR-associated protein Cas10/Cmr2 [Anaerolinea sp.]|nr:type III-B CRISPR-associated protein Cas10/Cmr2 [Anaerolinea sp.]
MTSLYLFQIGPVQSFIAAARRTQDLYVGSRLLTLLAKAGITQAQQLGVDDDSMIFPAMKDGNLPTSIPHRFAFLSEREDMGALIETAIRDYWIDHVVNEVGQWVWDQIGDGEWMERYRNQTQSWLECFWVRVAYDPRNHGESYSRASVAMASRRQLRDFPQMVDVGEKKCTLTGMGAALSNDERFWDRLRDSEPLRHQWGEDDHMVIRTNERLGAVALIKRVGQWAVPALREEADQIMRFSDLDTIAREGKPEPKGEKQPLYLAILHMDGDHMGRRLSACKEKAQHQQLSLDLALFAEYKAPEIVKEHSGTLIYAGGDDVLALLPLRKALPCANELRNALSAAIGQGASASAGIALMKASLPLDGAMDDARQAEKIAKNEFGRNAVAIRDSRSTAIRETGAKWDEVAELVTNLQSAFEKQQGWLSSSIGYDVRAASPALWGTKVPAEARAFELRRLLKRRTDPKIEGKQEKINELAEPLIQLGEKHGWDRLGDWMILARFLASGGGHS